jgi:hypothetical protein
VQIDRTGVWLLLAAACAFGLLYAMRDEVVHGFYGRHARGREAPAAFAGSLMSAVLTGLGLGMSAACAIVGLAVVFERLGLSF